MQVRTRFAPSPTGYLHIGGARTALFSWLFARANGGSFVLRIEDTDKERSTQASVDAILHGMEWLGLDYDEGPFYQTQRFDRYNEVIQKLLDEGKAYRCYCSKEELEAMREQQIANKQRPQYDRRYRDFSGEPPADVAPVIRFKNPLDGVVVIEDQVLGQITISNQELDDLIIARSDGTPTYNLTVVVDDMDMQITHVIRGDDHINNTPRQINLIEALGGTPPIYAHAPMILGDDGKRMSKRHGAVSVSAYAEEGILRDAMLNYLVRLGWSHGDQEVFSTAEMLELFKLAGINKSASTFDVDKLHWLNQQYLKEAVAEELADELAKRLPEALQAAPREMLLQVVELQRERVKTLSEMAETSVLFFQDPTEYDPKPAKKFLNKASLPILNDLIERLAQLNDWQPEAIQSCIADYADEKGLKFGKVGPPVRIAVCGNGNSPGLDQTLATIGQEAVVRRLKTATSYIENLVEPAS